MLVEEFLEPKIHIVSGKGGVGKTTVAAALAMVAARHGRKVCIAAVDRKQSLPKLFGGGEVSYEPRELSPDVWALNITPENALAEYLQVQYHMRRLSWVFTSTHFVDYITTAAPGLRDILTLGKIWYLEQDRGTKHDFNTIVVDAPAAGHMLTFLSAPMGLSDAVRVGPVRRQAEWLVQMLRDPKRTQAHIVTLAEEMPVAETLETSEALSERVGLAQGVILANGIYSDLLEPEQEKLLADVAVDELKAEGETVGLSLDAEDLDALVNYARFLEARRDIQLGYLKTLRRRSDSPVLELPFLFSAGLALPDIETLADVIEERVGKL